MKRPNITPGKWIESEKDRHGLWIENDGDEPEEICMVSAATVSCPEFRANVKAITAVPELLAALEEAQELIKTARQHFPKSVKNADRFKLELTSASISKALAKAGYEFP